MQNHLPWARLYKRILMNDYLEKLVALPTTTNNIAANTEALTYLATFFAEKGLFVAHYDFDGHGALVATTKEGDKTPKVLLGAHVDVVPGPDQLFKLRQADGKLYGRGTYDMKFAIASYMQTLDTIGSDITNYDLGIMITTDEEIGGMYGTERLVEMGYRPEVCILPDGGQNWHLETLAKGFIFGEIQVNGQTAHGSRPWEGDSATFRLVETLHEIVQLFHEQAIDTNSLNISIVEGGDAINQIPGSARATLDIRYLSMTDYQAISEQLTAISEKHGAKFQENFKGAPGATDLEHPLVKPFVESIVQTTGREVSGTLSVGSSDARFFAEIGVPCILTHPDGGGQHADDEWIDATGVEQFTAVLLSYLAKVGQAA